MEIVYKKIIDLYNWVVKRVKTPNINIVEDKIYIIRNRNENETFM